MIKKSCDHPLTNSLHVKEEEENFHFHSLIFFPFCACQVRMKSVWQPPIKEEEKYKTFTHREWVSEREKNFILSEKVVQLSRNNHCHAILEGSRENFLLSLSLSDYDSLFLYFFRYFPHLQFHHQNDVSRWIKCLTLFMRVYVRRDEMVEYRMYIDDDETRVTVQWKMSIFFSSVIWNIFRLIYSK